MVESRVTMPKEEERKILFKGEYYPIPVQNLLEFVRSDLLVSAKSRCFIKTNDGIEALLKNSVSKEGINEIIQG